MGDRISASLYFREEYYPILLAAKGKDCLSYCDLKIREGVVELVDYEANYGDIYIDTASSVEGYATGSDRLRDVLDEMKIPYNTDHENGSDYGACGYYSRFIDGELTQTECVKSDDGMIGIQALKERLEGVGWTDREDMLEYLDQKLFEQGPPDGEYDLAKIPLRELTEEEASIVMEYKMKQKGDSK